MELELLAFHDRSTVCWIVAPVPLALCDALLLAVTNDRFAVTVPVVVGANVTVYGTLCPAAIVSGNVSPPSVNSVLLEFAEDTTTLPPLAVRLPFWLELLPTSTLPKLSEPGETPSVPAGLVPLPDNATFTEGLDAFEANASVALSVPVTVGANDTFNVAVLPAFNVNGHVNPLMLNPVPLTVAPETVRLEPPVLESVIV